MEVFQGLLGSQRVWELTIVVDDHGVLMPRIARTDGKFFELGLATKGYDRPMMINYGPGMTSAVFTNNGRVLVEREKVITSIDGAEEIQQDRVLRASADNPNYQNIPRGAVTGYNYADAQRIIYRDSPVESRAMAADKVVMKKSGEEFVPCQAKRLSDFGGEYDGPGKSALFDAMAFYLTPEEMDAIGRTIYDRAKADAEAMK